MGNKEKRVNRKVKEMRRKEKERRDKLGTRVIRKKEKIESRKWKKGRENEGT